MTNDLPIISFTFDDFPKSALLVAGRILEENGVRGTYYASLGLIGRQGPTGVIFDESDLQDLLVRGHELGCHTFAHCDASTTSPEVFEQSVLDNARALKEIAPQTAFKTHSYPIGAPKAETKKRCASYFETCRGGGQTYNKEIADLNRLDAFFIEQSRDRPEAIKAVIDDNLQKHGWLILATHDVCEQPTRFGCTPELFVAVVDWAKGSGANLLTISDAYSKLTRHFASETECLA